LCAANAQSVHNKHKSHSRQNHADAVLVKHAKGQIKPFGYVYGKKYGAKNKYGHHVGGIFHTHHHANYGQNKQNIGNNLYIQQWFEFLFNRFVPQQNIGQYAKQ
jgi:hypothetical protein